MTLSLDFSGGFATDMLCTCHNPHPVTHAHTHARMHTQSFYGPLGLLSRTTRVSWHQKGKTNLDLLQQEIVSGSGII